ncbi:MAG: (Fe-S)-binding protein [Candidatus Helarchaeota archaeon]
MRASNIEDIMKELGKCTLCKICEENCSIFLATGKYPPYKKLEVVRELIQKPKDRKPEDWEAVFLCTKCEACDECCPEKISLMNIIDFGRKLCVERWGIQYPRQRVIIENIQKYGNPFGNSESRIGWLEEKFPKSNTLLHLGCMMSYPLRSMGKSIIRILRKLGVDFTISPDEKCCGYFVFNTGNHEAAQKIIAQNSEEFEQYNQIITLCCGCYTFLKEHYSLRTPIRHVIEIISEKLKEKDLKSTPIHQKIVFQDSCHIARPHGIVEHPRALIKKMGFELAEFDLPLCCGADGGMRIINPEVALEVGKMRLLEAQEKGDVLTTLCPFCIAHFRDTAEKLNINIQITSLFELLEKLLP